MADDTKKGADAGQADAKPKRSKKMLLIVGPLLLLLLGGGGGAGWYFYSKSQAADGDESAEAAKPADRAMVEMALRSRSGTRRQGSGAGIRSRSRMICSSACLSTARICSLS